MESFSCFLEILEDFQSHMRGTFLDMFRSNIMYLGSKRYCMKDKNLNRLNYKTSDDLVSKHPFFRCKNVAEKTLLHIYGVRSIYNIMSVCTLIRSMFCSRPDLTRSAKLKSYLYIGNKNAEVPA